LRGQVKFQMARLLKAKGNGFVCVIYNFGDLQQRPQPS
jgi:hypothetical protein